MQRFWPIWLSSSSQSRWQLPLPTQCLACHSWPCHEVLCKDCKERFQSPALRCAGCALVLPGLSAERPRCGRCIRHPPLWNKAWVCVDYAYPWNTLITRWKFAQQPALAAHFARWMACAPAVQAMLQQADVVVPIPLSAQRMHERGYNPAAQLAQHLCKSKYQLHILIRTQHTPAQSGLDRAQRLRNLQHAFAINTCSSVPLQNQRVVLIDDVMTTGATLTMASRCLLQAGAAQVQVLCMARTP